MIDDGWPTGTQEGWKTVAGFRMFYRICGPEGTRGTVLCLHGGPGATHEYLQPFSDLVATGYRVVFFDQLGCGRSERVTDTSLFTVEHNVLEVEEMREALGLGRVHLVGSSYGGALAIAYTLAHPEHVRALVTVGGLASIPLTVREMQRLIGELPGELQKALATHGKLGEFQHPEYLAAVEEFYHRHLCRLSPWPEAVRYSLEQISKPVYGFMNGPNEFTIVGSLKDWDISLRLPEIRAPTLVTGGRFDEVSPRVARQIAEGIPGSEQTTFEKSSHMPFWEEREAFVERVGRFLGARR